MSIRNVAAVWTACFAVIAWNVASPSFPFGSLWWWRAGWWIAVAAHLSVALGLRRLRAAMLFAVAPPMIRALSLAWYVLRVDPAFGGGQLWTDVALYAAVTVGVAGAYSHASTIRAVDDAAHRA